MKRDEYVDFLKGGAILATIIGHCISEIPRMSVLFNIIYSFHMPLLMFISAYIEEKNSEKYRKIPSLMILRRIEGLMIPYFSWSILSCISWKGGLSFSLIGIGRRLLGYNSGGLWFLAVLFGLKCMHLVYWYIINKRKRDSLLFNILTFILLESIITVLAAITKFPYVINMLSYAIPYYGGILWAKNYSINNLVKNEKIALGVFIGYAVTFLFFDFHNAEPITQMIRIFLSLCVIILCCKYQIKWQKNSRWKDVLCLFGKESMVIYLLHGYFTDYANLLSKIDSVWVSEIVAVILSVGVAFTCILIGRVLGISSYLSKILFGK